MFFLEGGFVHLSALFLNKYYEIYWEFSDNENYLPQEKFQWHSVTQPWRNFEPEFCNFIYTNIKTKFKDLNIEFKTKKLDSSISCVDVIIPAKKHRLNRLKYRHQFDQLLELPPKDQVSKILGTENPKDLSLLKILILNRKEKYFRKVINLKEAATILENADKTYDVTYLDDLEVKNTFFNKSS